MKILFVSAVLPYPLHSGGQIRIYNLLKRLGAKHEITLCAFVRRPDELQYLKELPFCRYVYMIYRGSAWQPNYVLKASFGRYPFLLTTYDNSAMRELLNGLLTQGQYDLIHLEPFYVWPSVPKTRIPIVVGEHNVEYEVYQHYVRRFPVVPLRPLLYLDTLKLRFWEGYIWRKADAITAVSQYDERVIRRLNKKVYRVSNGVDLTEFPFDEKRMIHEDPVLLFVGNFKWLPNRDAARRLVSDIWPLVLERFPRAKLRIVGRTIPTWLRKLRAQPLGLSVDENVVDIRLEYEGADVLVAPLSIAGGTKFKILEAFASGLPVITSKEGIAGLGVKRDYHYLEADTSTEYVEQIKRFFENKNLRQKLAINARRFVETSYGWDQIVKKLEVVWQDTYAKNKDH